MTQTSSHTALKQRISDLKNEVAKGREAIQALRQSEESYAYLVKNATDIIYKINLKGYFIFFNPVAVHTTGYSEDELYARHYLDLIRPDYRDAANRLYIEQYTKRTASTYFEFPLIRKDGQELWFGQNVQLLWDGDRIIGFHAIARDINRQKRLEEALKHSQEALESGIREKTAHLRHANTQLREEIDHRRSTETHLKNALNALEFLSVTAMDFLRPAGDENIYDLVGDRLREVLNHSFIIINSYDKASNLFCTESIKGFGTHLNRILGLLGRHPVGMTFEMNNEEARQRLGSGRLMPGPKGLHELSFGAVPAGVAYAIEKLLGIGDIYVVAFSQKEEIFGSTIIITRRGREKDDIPGNQELIETFINQASVALQRKRAEQALRESEDKYRELVQHAPAGIYEFDMEKLKFISVNDVMCEYTGYSESEFLELNPYDILSEESKQGLNRLVEEVFSTQPEELTTEYKLKGKNGREFWVPANAKFFYDAGLPKRAMTVVHDLTELRRAEAEKRKLEAQLQQAQKMEAIATLAGGIAHQFNNALSVIVGNLELMEMKRPEKDIERHLSPIKDTANRMSDLTNQLLAYARGGKYQPTTIAMDRLVKETLPLIEHTLAPSIQVETDLDPEVSAVRVDLTQMQMVLSAVLFNASEAINASGRIRIACTDDRIEASRAVEIPGAEPGAYVRLTVSDEGSGMDEETKRRIFRSSS